MELELPWLLAPDLPSNKQVNLTWSSITLGHKISLSRGVHLTEGQPDQSSNTLSHQMSLLGEGSGYDFVRWSISQPAAIGQPTSHVQKCQPVRLWVGQIVGGGRTGGLTTLGLSPGSQHSHWFPLGEWPTWPRPGKWHKQTLQPFIYHWHYNLCISFQHQSGVLLHKGTTL